MIYAIKSCLAFSGRDALYHGFTSIKKSVSASIVIDCEITLCVSIDTVNQMLQFTSTYFTHIL